MNDTYHFFKLIDVPSFPLKEQPVPARILLPPEFGLDERIPALHFVAGQFEEYLLVLPEVFDHKFAPIPYCHCSCAVFSLIRARLKAQNAGHARTHELITHITASACICVYLRLKKENEPPMNANTLTCYRS